MIRKGHTCIGKVPVLLSSSPCMRRIGGFTLSACITRKRGSHSFISSAANAPRHTDSAPALSVSRQQFSKLWAMSEYLADRRQTFTKRVICSQGREEVH
jgi:hypothetical protein